MAHYFSCVSIFIFFVRLSLLLIPFTIFYFFLIQFIYLKRKILLSGLFSLLTVFVMAICKYFILTQGYWKDLFRSPSEYELADLHVMLIDATFLYIPLFLFYLTIFFIFAIKGYVQEKRGTARPLNKREDILIARIFWTKDKVIQEELKAYREGKTYRSIWAFSLYVLIFTFILHFCLEETQPLLQRMGVASYHSLLFLPFLFFVYMHFYPAAILIFAFFVKDSAKIIRSPLFSLLIWPWSFCTVRACVNLINIIRIERLKKKEDKVKKSLLIPPTHPEKNIS